MGKLLSMASRVQLVQSIIQAMLLYRFMIYYPTMLSLEANEWLDS